MKKILAPMIESVNASNEKPAVSRAGFLLIGLVSTALLLCAATGELSARALNDGDVTPNAPVGVGRGNYPGRVVWVHDPAVANWNGTTGFWWNDSVTSQPEAQKMLHLSLMFLTHEKTERAAWDNLFKYFNTTHGRGAKGYASGEKIGIKINMNNTDSHAPSNEINTSPQIVFAMLKSMIEEGRVPAKNITVFDPSRYITDNVFTKCHAAFPDVVFVDNTGGDGRVKATYKENAIPYSMDNGKLATGLVTCAVEAKYLINIALLKGHVGQGVTLCGKNYYGATNIDKDWRKNAHNNFDQDRAGKPKYMTFVDFMGHKDLGGKTMLFVLDGFYATRAVNGTPGPKWKMAPFNDNWASSLFISQDGVAIDAVGLDFLRAEWPTAPDMKYAEQYMIEAALANDPPSKTTYDPERDGSTLKSLGVWEHWDSPVTKRYSQDFEGEEGTEPVKKNGIELIQLMEHKKK